MDVATFTEHNAYGFGIVAQDDKGALIQVKTICRFGLVSAYMAEALAIKEVLSWIQERGWSRVTIESDCLTTFQAIRSTVPMRSPFGHVVQSCRNMLGSFNTTSLYYIKRSTNMTAHELARMSYSFPYRLFDKMSVPIGVKNVLSSDLTH